MKTAMLSLLLPVVTLGVAACVAPAPPPAESVLVPQLPPRFEYDPVVGCPVGYIGVRNWEEEHVATPCGPGEECTDCVRRDLWPGPYFEPQAPIYVPAALQASPRGANRGRRTAHVGSGPRPRAADL